MRLRILKPPTGTIDGVSLGQFHVGHAYELGSAIGCVFIAEGWAELVNDDSTAVFAPPTIIASSAPLVLVVDDDPEVRRLTELLLAEHGYLVVLAEHGRAAMQRLCDHYPDLIVLDLNMPVMNGWDFCAEQRYLARGNRATAPVLLMSGEDDAEAQADRLQAIGVLKKPVDPDDLLAAVSAAIGSMRSAPDGIGSPRPPLRRRQGAH
jgi:CheY-like chemotaxis protein